MKKSLRISIWVFWLASSIAAIGQTLETEEISTENSSRHQFVMRGDGLHELKSGDYVIVGMCLRESDAKRMMEELKRLEHPVPSYGYLSNTQLWYLFFGGKDDIETAHQERDKYRKMKMFKNAWLLTVHQ